MSACVCYDSSVASMCGAEAWLDPPAHVPDPLTDSTKNSRQKRIRVLPIYIWVPKENVQCDGRRGSITGNRITSDDTTAHAPKRTPERLP